MIELPHPRADEQPLALLEDRGVGLPVLERLDLWVEEHHRVTWLLHHDLHAAGEHLHHQLAHVAYDQVAQADFRIACVSQRPGLGTLVHARGEEYVQ